jgi:hypothetical protein
MMLSSCTDEPSGPQPPAPIDTTSHEFAWEVDTLFFEGTTVPVYFEAKAFYGTRATNVYLAGYSTAMDQMCWHWDGFSWNKVDLFYGFRDIVDFDGIDSTFLVFTGLNAGPNPGLAVLDYGVLSELAPPKHLQWTTCIHVVSRDEIYLGGRDGIQLYNGKSWEWILDTTDQIVTQSSVEFTPIDIYKHQDGGIEITSRRDVYPEKTKYFLWRLSGDNMTVIDTFISRDPDITQIRFGCYFMEGDDGVYTSSMGGIFKRVNSSWKKLHKRVAVHVAGKENSLVSTSNSDLYHYNGSDWRDLLPIIRMQFEDASFDSVSELFYADGVFFIAARSNDRTIIFRGRQK